MGLFSKIRQAFGFGGNDFDDDEDTFAIDATVQPLVRGTRPDNDTTAPDDSEGPGEDLQADDNGSGITPSVPLDSIFNTVVEEFNRAMPSFIGTGANAESQRRHLLEALDADVRQYLDSLQESAREQCNRRWERDRLRLNGELDSARARLKSLEENETDKGRQLLSAERQKRALNERIHDLESQVANLEAEKDQYELETRSLVNKLRVSNMLNEGAEIPDVATYEDSLARLQGELDESHARVAALTADNDSLQARCAELASVNTALETSQRDLGVQLEALKVKTEMTDVMINDLNMRASAASKDVRQRDTEIESLKDSLNESRQEADSLRAQLEEAQASLEIASSIQDEVERIQETITRKNTQISELNLELRRRDDRINALEAEENSLRKTIETNLMAQAESEKNLREEIERLRQQQSASGREKPRAKRRPAAKISAIDEDLDNTDWLVATPPEGTSAKTSGVSDSEFGYQEPPRRNPPENSAQMSLW